MKRPRIIENEGVKGESVVESYDKLMRNLMDKGYIDTKIIIDSGICSGKALEIGQGPGYLGIDWLLKNSLSTLVGLDVSIDMIRIAKRKNMK